MNSRWRDRKGGVGEEEKILEERKGKKEIEEEKEL